LQKRKQNSISSIKPGMLVNIIRVNSKGRHVRSRFPLHLTGGLLEAPYLTPKTDKGTVVNLYFWEGAKDS
jgi:hypothetical protein